MIMKNFSSKTLLEKSSDHSRSLLFGLLIDCIFSGNGNGNCPLSRLRDTFTFEEKYKFIMKLSMEEVFIALDQHEECYEKECYPQRCGAKSWVG